VGRIQRIDKRTAVKFNLREGDRVTAITRWGGNSRYACVPAKLLVKVPGNLDPGKSVCLAETYLSAFQSVHYGQPEGVRYSKDSLAGKVILVVEGYTNVGLAAISLAIHAGAIVYTTAKEKHFQELTRLGAIPLTRDPFDWLPLLGERMDIVIAVGGVYSDAEEPANHYHLRALREGGFLVLVGDPGDQWIPKILSRSAGSIGCAVGMSKADLVSTHKYNVFEQWTDDLEGSKRDLRHLLKLLQNGVFNPKVIDRIPLSRVPKAQELIQDKSHNGIIVCEPWIRSKHRSVLL
jgi:NADPH:quinone reductase-like Zn-dependent oxidoreductase